MFNFKLYRYYCRKLLELWWLVLFYVLIFFGWLYLLWGGNFKLNTLQEVGKGGWLETFHSFWLISLGQLLIMWSSCSQLVARLTGLKDQWGGMMKKSKSEDINVLLFTPGVNRETVIFAKLAAVATYFWALNFFFLTLPVFFYLWFKIGASVLVTLAFLLVNGVFFALTNFSLMVPVLFFFYENYSVSAMMIFIALAVIFAIVYYMAKDFIYSSTIVPFLFFPLSFLFGSFFFYLYWKEFSTKDLA